MKVYPVKAFDTRTKPCNLLPQQQRRINHYYTSNIALYLLCHAENGNVPLCHTDLKHGLLLGL